MRMIHGRCRQNLRYRPILIANVLGYVDERHVRPQGHADAQDQPVVPAEAIIARVDAVRQRL